MWWSNIVSLIHLLFSCKCHPRPYWCHVEAQSGPNVTALSCYIVYTEDITRAHQCGSPSQLPGAQVTNWCRNWIAPQETWLPISIPLTEHNWRLALIEDSFQFCDTEDGWRPGNLVTRDIMSLQHTQHNRSERLNFKTIRLKKLHFHPIHPPLDTAILVTTIGIMLLLLNWLYSNSRWCQSVLITPCIESMLMFELNVSSYVTWCHNMTRDTCLMSYSANVPMMPQTHITQCHSITPMFRETRNTEGRHLSGSGIREREIITVKCDHWLYQSHYFNFKKSKWPQHL